MAPFYGWGSTASRLVSLRGGSLTPANSTPANVYLFKGSNRNSRKSFVGYQNFALVWQMIELN